MTLNASPIEFVPVAHAVTVQEFTPFAPKAIETCPVAISGIIIGMKNGLTRRAPFSNNVEYWFSNVSIPPIPEPIQTPTFGAISSVIVKSASLTAANAATIAY